MLLQDSSAREEPSPTAAHSASSTHRAWHHMSARGCESWITGAPFGRTAVERLKLGEGLRMEMTDIGGNLAACSLTSLAFTVSTKLGD